MNWKTGNKLKVTVINSSQENLELGVPGVEGDMLSPLNNTRPYRRFAQVKICARRRIRGNAANYYRYEILRLGH